MQVQKYRCIYTKTCTFIHIHIHLHTYTRPCRHMHIAYTRMHKHIIIITLYTKTQNRHPLFCCKRCDNFCWKFTTMSVLTKIIFAESSVVCFRCIFPQLKSRGNIRRKVSLKIKICLFSSIHTVRQKVENLEWCLFWCSRTLLTFGENFRWKWNVCFCLHAYLRKFNKPWDRSTRNYLQIKIPTMTCGWFLKFGWMCNCL